MILTYTLLAVAITALVLYLRQLYSKFSRDGVNHLPVVPFFGNFLWVVLKKEHMIDCLMKTTTTFPDDRIIGHYDLVTPVYIVCNVEAMKRLTIKDFEHFVDRRQFTSKFDPIFGRGLLMLDGNEWKAMRSTLSPAFTSSKIRLMVPFMEEVGKEMNKVLKDKIKDSGNTYIDVESRDMMQRYGNDVIASCAFGLKVNSQTVDHEFYLNSKEITIFSFMRILRVILSRFLPSVAKMVKLSLVRRETTEYFTNVVLGTMRDREKNNIVRNDLINILAEMKKATLLGEDNEYEANGIVKTGQLTHEKKGDDTDAGFATVQESHIGRKQHSYEWSDTDFVAQAALFLFAGFDTTSTSMSFLLYELALNPDVQNRLLEEIREHDGNNGGKIDYNSIQSMTYLDMVVSEGLRLWPPVAIIDRRCVKDYNFGRPNSQATKDLIIREGEIVVYAPWAFHRNPKYFPDPTKFDPERFSPKNRHKIIPFTYMPFGMGPRNCIGSRFALCEMKVMLYLLIRDMELYPCEQTCFPPELILDVFNLALRGGTWVRIRARPH